MVNALRKPDSGPLPLHDFETLALCTVNQYIVDSFSVLFVSFDVLHVVDDQFLLAASIHVLQMYKFCIFLLFSSWTMCQQR